MGMSGGLVTVMKSKANNTIDIHFWWIFWSQIEMILNVCWCWGRSSWWFTLSDISCPLWRASKISHLKFYVARLFANLLNECKITADASGCNLCMLIYVEWLRLMIMEGQSHCRFIMTDGSAVIIVSSTPILMSVKAQSPRVQERARSAKITGVCSYSRNLRPRRLLLTPHQSGRLRCIAARSGSGFLGIINQTLFCMPASADQSWLTNPNTGFTLQQ